MDQVIKATNFAAIAHKNQRRKDANKTPYINHPIEVAHLLSLAGVSSPEILCAALLHDVVEDCGITLEEINKEFGLIVANIVALVSDNKSLSKVTRKKLQVEHMIEMSRSCRYTNGTDVHTCAILVKLADKYSNCKGLLDNPPSFWSREEIIGYAVWSYAIVSKVRGLSTYMDNLFAELFELFGNKWEIDFKDLTSIKLNDMLETYYSSI